MEKLDLSSLGLQELSASEMKETNGGLLLVILAVCAVSLLVSSCMNTQTVITNDVDKPEGGARSDSTLAK